MIIRHFAAPIDRVWTAFADADALAAWFWPGSFDTKVTADVWVGGAYRIESASADMAVSGNYREVVPPGRLVMLSRLVMTWRWDGDEHESLVTIELIPTAGGTEVRLRHEQLVDDHDRGQHEQGWNDCLDRLMSHIG